MQRSGCLSSGGWVDGWKGGGISLFCTVVDFHAPPDLEFFLGVGEGGKGGGWWEW